MKESDFNRVAFEAARKLDMLTTGVDGVKKLLVAFPTDEVDAEAVKHCFCALVSLMHGIRTAEGAALKSTGYTETANGLQGKIISSVSAGNESISYADGPGGYFAAVYDRSVREKMYAELVREHLSGACDANGVNLLYMGRYPRR
jgi:hypothetical protein